jgi:hypothetical protein
MEKSLRSNKQISLLTIIVLTLLVIQGCGGENNENYHEKLNGRWTSDLMTVEIDFGSGTYTGVALGQQFSREIELVSATKEVIEFTSNGTTIIAQFQSDGSILLTRDGGIPVNLKRAE